MTISSYSIQGLLSENEIAFSDHDKILEELIKTRKICKNLDTCIENCFDGIYIVDGEANTLRVNKAYEEMSGLKREFLEGRNLRELEGKYISKSSALIAIKERKTITMEQTLAITGKKVLLTTRPIYDIYGNIEMIVTNLRDISELEELKNQLITTENIKNEYELKLRALKEQLFSKHHIIAEDRKMLDVLQKVDKVAKLDTTVLLLGETGVGKEEVAKYIHENSHRAKEAFVKINCGAISETLFESELFGYSQGAFTGAKKEGKMGLFEAADKGTIFLDEIGEMPLDMQVKLLRVLQEGVIERIGGVKPIKIDIRVITATNRNLKDMVKNKQFRDDLFYRINVVPITIPPLRERVDDITPLAEHFLKAYNEKHKLNKALTNGALRAMVDYDWPGNVRELKNIVERTLIMCNTEQITVGDLQLGVAEKSTLEGISDELNLTEILERIEFNYIIEAYNQYKSVRLAAKHLGMTPTTYVRKKKIYGTKFASQVPRSAGSR